MKKPLEQVTFDVNALKKQYDEHALKCKKIAEEVNKWGKKTSTQLAFLKAHKS